MPNDDDQVTYPAKNDNAFITLGEAAESARKAFNMSLHRKVPPSKTIYGGQSGEA